MWATESPVPCVPFQPSFHPTYPDGAQLKAGDKACGGNVQSQKGMVGRLGSRGAVGRSTEVVSKK